LHCKKKQKEAGKRGSSETFSILTLNEKSQVTRERLYSEERNRKCIRYHERGGRTI
jgi:hypothetical protein